MRITEICTLVMGCLSIIGSSSLFFGYFKFRKSSQTWKSLRHMICLLSLSDINRSVVDVLPGAMIGGVLCDVQALFLVFWSTATFWWTASISIHLFVSLVYPGADDIRWLKWIFHAFVWAFATMTLSVALTLHAYGPLGDGSSWCWVPEEFYNVRLLCYSQLWFCWLIAIVFYALSYRAFNQVKSQTDALVVVRVYTFRKALLVVPIAFVVIMLPSTVRRVWQLFDPSASLEVLAVFQAITSPSQGFCNGLTFVVLDAEWRKFLTPRIVRNPWKQWREKMARHTHSSDDAQWLTDERSRSSRAEGFANLGDSV
eukprot:TRINITY_DN15829_c0_g1_i1.p1 TRINITY_DN15829_c0_g1~~TRINITY_DN15829_c0_g1_i1.p1  ORF type:complete len:313 (+),score=43.86 TRINITY_DN15829_c0_g1_i1:46-984(+)